MGFSKNDFALAILYIVALLGLFAFQLWTVSTAIVGAILVLIAATLVEKAWVERRVSEMQSVSESRHRELNEKVGQQLLFFAGEIEALKSTINKSLFSIEARLGRIGDMESKYHSLIEKLIDVENKIGAIRTSVESQRQIEQQPSY